MPPFEEALSKVMLVADTAAASLANQLKNTGCQLFENSLLAAHAPRQAFQEFTIANRLLSQDIAECERLSKARDDARGQREFDVVDDFENRLRYQQQKATDIRVAVVDANRRFEPLRIEYAQKVNQERMSFDLMAQLFVSTLRGELHVDANESLFMRHFKDDQDVFQQRYAAVVDALKAQGVLK